MTYAPTDEQQHAIDAFQTGDNLKIYAGAGTGKTSTLRFIADAGRGKRGLYAAFNKAIATDAKRRFAGTGVQTSTIHSLAYATHGAPHRDRLNQRFLFPAQQKAVLGIDTRFPIGGTYLSWQTILRLTKEALAQFCRSMDDEPAPHHVTVPATVLGRPEELAALRSYVADKVRVWWADWMSVDGALAWTHDTYLKCQPAGTLVQVVRKDGHKSRAVEVPIEDIKVGDKVVSWNGKYRLGIIRRAGELVERTASRKYTGELVTIETPSGHSSTYTHDHICIARIGDLADGHTHIVYAMRNHDGQYRIGRTMWRYGSQGNYVALAARLKSQGAEAAWVLSTHADAQSAALAEATVAYDWALPTWMFQTRNEHMSRDGFWAHVGDNSARGEACLRSHGRDHKYPFITDTDRVGTRRAIEVRACNLLPGMQVCVPELAEANGNGATITGGWTDAWQSISISKESVVDTPVYSIEVANTHTYVADGIVTHNCWALTHPQLPYDYIMLDEAQDLEPLTRGIMLEQDAQIIAVGDPNQAIYTWRGATNALDSFGGERAMLTQSFRFGDAIAEEANFWLALLESDMRLSGLPGKDSSVWASKRRPEAILTRTNGGAMQEIIDSQQHGIRVGVAGDRKAKELIDLANAALDLQRTGKTKHRDLDVFTSWTDVMNYVEDGDAEGDLAALVKVVDKYGAPAVVKAMESVVPASTADQVVSTVHVAKGLEWIHVRISEDFQEPKTDKATGEQLPLAAEEARLAYVAVTRAERHLDPTGLDWAKHMTGGVAVETSEPVLA